MYAAVDIGFHEFQHGITQTSELVNITDFFNAHILPDLQKTDGTIHMLQQLGTDFKYKIKIMPTKKNNSFLPCSLVKKFYTSSFAITLDIHNTKGCLQILTIKAKLKVFLSIKNVE